MSEQYKGWTVYSKRVGYVGAWAGEAVKDDRQIFTKRFAGTCAKQKALEAIKAMIDDLSEETQDSLSLTDCDN